MTYNQILTFLVDSCVVDDIADLQSVAVLNQTLLSCTIVQYPLLIIILLSVRICFLQVSCVMESQVLPFLKVLCFTQISSFKDHACSVMCHYFPTCRVEQLSNILWMVHTRFCSSTHLTVDSCVTFSFLAVVNKCMKLVLY